MLKTYNIKCKRFVADQIGIDQLKNEFFDEAREFVYFRKGEWEGFINSLNYAIDWASNNPEYTAIAIALYTPTKDLISYIVQRTGASIEKVKSNFGKPKKGYISRKVIVRKGRLTKEEIVKWEEICGKGSIETIPKSQVGKFRYIVNEKRYAIFCRHGENDLRGIIGYDKWTIQVLREIFDREFIEASIKNKKK